MFFTGIDLTKETLSKSINNHKIIGEKLKDAKWNYPKIVRSGSFRTALRMALYEKLISEL